VSLFPVFTPRRGAPLEDRNPRYPTGYQWDFNTAALALDGAGRVIPAEGYTAWLLWCIKCVSTERYAYPIYSRQYGVQFAGVPQMRPDQARAHIMREITEALMNDRRTGRVINFNFVASEADGLIVSFLAEPAVGSSVQIRLLVRTT
jgi:hypothetical protein